MFQFGCGVAVTGRDGLWWWSHVMWMYRLAEEMFSKLKHIMISFELFVKRKCQLLNMHTHHQLDYVTVSKWLNYYQIKPWPFCQHACVFIVISNQLLVFSFDCILLLLLFSPSSSCQWLLTPSLSPCRPIMVWVYCVCWVKSLGLRLSEALRLCEAVGAETVWSLEIVWSHWGWDWMKPWDCVKPLGLRLCEAVGAEIVWSCWGWDCAKPLGLRLCEAIGAEIAWSRCCWDCVKPLGLI